MLTETVTLSEHQRRIVQSEQTAHLAGYFDARGSTYLNIRQKDSFRINYTIKPFVEIYGLNEDDPIVGKLLSYCDEYHIRNRIADRKNQNLIFQIDKPKSVERFLKPLRPYLVSNYVRTEVMLEEALPAIHDDQHRNKQGFYELVGLADEMREDTESKYDQEYFAEKWSVAE